MKKIACTLLAVGVGACSSIVEGTSQEVAVNTDPPGANCVLKRQDFEIGRIATTPGTVRIQKTKYDVSILCDKEGYQQASYRNHSDAAAATFGNAIVGGLVGWAIDSSTGADNKYESPVSIKLEPSKAAETSAKTN